MTAIFIKTRKLVNMKSTPDSSRLFYNFRIVKKIIVHQGMNTYLSHDGGHGGPGSSNDEKFICAERCRGSDIIRMFLIFPFNFDLDFNALLKII